MEKFEVGFVQIAPILGRRDETIGRIEQIITGRVLPKILVFPELCNSGYNFADAEQARQTSETVTDSPFLEYLSGLCRKSGGYIVTGLNERDGDCIYNTAVLLGSDGPIGKYRKLHLFLNEKDYFQPGNLGLPVFDLGFCKLGMLICFDWIFPEAWRVLALKGADLICHPSNLVLPGLAQRGVGVHAMINRMYVILANRTGSEGDLSFTGRSLVADPQGSILVAADDTQEGLFTTEIDIEAARNKAVTARNDVLADRRPSEYRMLIDDFGTT